FATCAALTKVSAAASGARKWDPVKGRQKIEGHAGVRPSANSSGKVLAKPVVPIEANGEKVRGEDTLVQ
ncbi:MAG: hypothetical protein LBC63_10890, partial [Holophagales bacterium]|nr:hypothetical protein [Holophagales bacterium]